MTSNHRALDDPDKELIRMVKDTPALYDPNSPDFKIAYRKEQEWERIASAVGMQTPYGRKRWTALRDRYSRELKQLRLHCDSNEYGQNEFFKSMDFLRHFVKKRKERRSTTAYQKLEPHWDSSMEESMSKKDVHSEIIIGDGIQDESAFDGVPTNYGKVEMSSTDNYADYVEVDGTETYEYVDTTQTAECENVTIDQKALDYKSYAAAAAAGQVATSMAYAQQLHREQQQATLQSAEKCASLQVVPVTAVDSATAGSEDEFFCKTLQSYLKGLSRRHKIKAQVEIFQIVQKYIEIEEDSNESKH